MALPRGRHGLTREQVAQAQRDRLLRGMADAVAERGYAATTVADVLRRAKVSRETFYEQFTDKEDCFLATLDRGAELMALVLRARFDEARGTPLDRFAQVLATYLSAMAAESTVATVVLLESVGAGEAARARRFAVLERFVTEVATTLADDPAWQRLPDPTFAARLLVGGISSLVTATLAAGRPDDLPSLREPIMSLLRALT
ncbi:TetR/AcrR family transcriptional regulator [Actinophytocola xinjiangensis]|uniref:TetR/AcrR family transcriptional regulator n=1 Tax=Actinophytocola xinjiangensis TaxID=485602 RepID=UPI000B10F85F|nr:TetR/AcrR family transcriptional regulator [Actinophytocola xinjiangensis]